jgi:hypothetical protein
MRERAPASSLSNGVAAAERVIGAHEKTSLPPADWDLFYAALINPPEPNRKLKEAVRRYRARRLDEGIHGSEDHVIILDLIDGKLTFDFVCCANTSIEALMTTLQIAQTFVGID